MGDSVLIGKEPCPKCGSADNLARYSDGHAHCFGFGCKYFEPATEAGAQAPSGHSRKTMSDTKFVEGEPQALPARRITQETAKHFNYLVGEFSGEKAQVANYYDPATRELVGQKIRQKPDADGKKRFKVVGDIKKAGLYGQHLWRDGGKMVVVTEGEIDALTVSQLQGNKWPVVSVPNGAQSAKAALAAQLQWLLKFDTVVLMFDDDEPGRGAASECAQVLPVGRCKIATITGFKDANEALQAGQGAKIIDAIWSAKEYRPDGILTLTDIAAAIRKPVEWGLPWFDERLTKLTYGRRYGELYFLGAGTGIGKTDLFTQQMDFDLAVLEQSIAVFALEQEPRETGQRLAGKRAKKRFHIPDAGWTPEDLDKAVVSLEQKGKVFFYNTAGANFGATAWDTLKDTMRYLAQHEGVRIFYLDHLTALAAGEEDERKALERITAEMGGLVKELSCILIVISHLATPEGTPHEEGGRVMIRHFKGSRAIGFWAHFMFGMERDQQNEDPAVKAVTTFRVLKDRYTGNATGECIYFGYDRDTGMLTQSDAPPKPDEAKRHGFSDTTSNNTDF